MLRCLALSAVLIFASSQAHAVSAAPRNLDRASLGVFIEALEDPGGRLKLEDVRKPPYAGRFTHPAADPINFGYSDSAWWLRFRLPGGALPDAESE